MTATGDPMMIAGCLWPVEGEEPDDYSLLQFDRSTMLSSFAGESDPLLTVNA